MAIAAMFPSKEKTPKDYKINTEAQKQTWCEWVIWRQISTTFEIEIYLRCYSLGKMVFKR